ncbi:MAG: hypothetical protein COW66_07885 [Flavobacteriaceae bacterium CG18_big_fil_WC_8_21_14_2_50_34_36]|nr:MAG: hypothetical protein COW66_07885 [Flavobacteriaceae bacterium CG18_big_fil_WC_8_21_14_2_50_34_36]
MTGNGVTAMIKNYLRIYLPHLKTLTK